MPTIVAPGATSLSTTAFEPTRALSPTVTGSDDHAVAQRRMAFAGVQRRAAQRHALIEGDVVADLSGLADDDPGAVINENAPADMGGGMDLDAGDDARLVGDEDRDRPPTLAPEPVGGAVKDHRVDARIAEQHGQRRPGGRVTFPNAGDVFAKALEHVQYPHDIEDVSAARWTAHGVAEPGARQPIPGFI